MNFHKFLSKGNFEILHQRDVSNDFRIKRKSRKSETEADMWDPRSMDQVHGFGLLVYGSRVHGTVVLIGGVHVVVGRLTVD